MQFNQIYNRLKYPGDTLSERVFHGGFWVFSLRIVDRLLMLIRTIILARLLAPNDFGLFGIAMLALATLESFTQTGIAAALIQKKDDTQNYLDSAWTIQVFRGIIIAIVMIFGAPLVGVFFEEPRAIMLTRILAVSVLIFDFRNIGIVYFQKNLEFHKQFVYQFGGTIADLAIAIPAALIIRSVWALIFGLLARNFIYFTLSYIIHPYRPRFRLDPRKSKELFDFGKWIFGSSVLVFVSTQGDYIFLGKILGATALGFYQIAYKISNLPATEITHVISQVSFPAYSKIQEEIKALSRAFNKIFLITISISLPISVVIFLFAPGFVKYILGTKWLPIIGPVRILAMYGLIRSITAMWAPLYRATGVPKFGPYSQVFRVTGMFLPIYWLTINFGIEGVCISVIIGQVSVLIFHLYYTYKISNLAINFLEILRSMISVFCSVMAMILVYFAFNYMVKTLFHYVVFVVFAFFVYITSMVVFDRFFKNKALEEIKGIVYQSIHK